MKNYKKILLYILIIAMMPLVGCTKQEETVSSNNPPVQVEAETQDPSDYVLDDKTENTEPEKAPEKETEKTGFLKKIVDKVKEITSGEHKEETKPEVVAPVAPKEEKTDDVPIVEPNPKENDTVIDLTSSSKVYYAESKNGDTKVGAFVMIMDTKNRTYYLRGIDDPSVSEQDVLDALGKKAFSGKFTFQFDAFAPTVDLLGGIEIAGVQMDGDAAYHFWLTGEGVPDGESMTFLLRQKNFFYGVLTKTRDVIKERPLITLELYKNASSYVTSSLSIVSLLQLGLRVIEYEDLGLEMLNL